MMHLTTFVLDFANKPEIIQESFSRYYRTTILSGETDPNKLYDLVATMEEYQVFSNEDVERLVNLYLDGADRDKLDPTLDACTAVYKQLDTDDQIKFKSAAKAFVRTYGFLGAILPYGNADWERLSIFLNLLIPKLPSPREDDLSQGILEKIDLESYRNEAREVMSIRLEDADTEVAPVPAGKVGHIVEPEMDLLSVILSNFNDMFGNINWNDADNVRRQILEIPAMVSKDEKYQNAMRNSDEQSARLESERALQQVIFSIMADNMELFKQFQDNPSFKKWLSDLVFNLTYNKDGKPYEYPYTSGWYDYNYNYILENKTLKQTVTVRKTDAQSGKTVPAANTTYRVWSWDNISANGSTEHPLCPYTRKIVAADGTVTADTVVPPTILMDYSSLTLAPGESAAVPGISLDFVAPAAVTLKDGTQALSWTDAEKAEIRTDFANAYAVRIADTGIAKAEHQADGSWIITGVAAGTTRYSVTLPGDQVITGTVTVAEGAETAVEEPVTWKVDGHWIHQTIDYPNPYTLIDFKTDGTGTFILPDYLVYGDYLLYEIESPEGYVQAEPFAFTVNKSDANDSKIYLTLNIKQADVPQKARIVFEKSGDLLVGAEVYKTLLAMNGLKPIWKVGLLAGGTTFEVYAAEDIVTPEGTVYYRAGDLVDTVKTDRTGMAQSAELELGHYTVKEVATTWGYLTIGTHLYQSSNSQCLSNNLPPVNIFFHLIGPCFLLD